MFIFRETLNFIWIGSITSNRRLNFPLKISLRYDLLYLSALYTLHQDRSDVVMSSVGRPHLWEFICVKLNASYLVSNHSSILIMLTRKAQTHILPVDPTRGRSPPIPKSRKVLLQYELVTELTQVLIEDSIMITPAFTPSPTPQFDAIY